MSNMSSKESLMTAAAAATTSSHAPPPLPWKQVGGAKSRRWRRPLDGEELFMTWQERHRKGFMVLTSGFAIHHPDCSFDDFVQRIKRGWIEARTTLPMLACRFPLKKEYRTVEYESPADERDAERWADETVIVKRQQQFDWDAETANHPERPNHYVAMLRVLENAGERIGEGDEDVKGHLVLFTISHAMADIYTLCDVGRLLLEAASKPLYTNRLSKFAWSDEIPSLPTSLSTAYKHFLGQPTAREKKQSARYWGSLFMPLMKKKYCALPLNETLNEPGVHRVLNKMSVADSQKLVYSAKKAKVSVTALTYGALAFELEQISKRNGENHCVGIVRNNRRFFPVPQKHEHRASPAPAGTMTLIELPLSVQEEDKQDRILALARSFHINLQPHVDGSAAKLGLANVDALTRPYMAMQQHNVAAVLAWLPRIWSAKTAMRVVRAASKRSKAESAKPPPLSFSAHGDLDGLLPQTTTVGDGKAQLQAYHLFTRPGEDTLAVITYTYHRHFYTRIVCNSKFYDPHMIDSFVHSSVDHLRSLSFP